MGARSAWLATVALLGHIGCQSSTGEPSIEQTRQPLPKVSPSLPFEAIPYDAPAKGSAPAIARGENANLVAWSVAKVGLLAAVVTDSGEQLNSKPTLVTKTPAAPAVGWNGSSFVVAWWASAPDQSTYELVTRRMGLDGAFLDPAPIVVAAAPWNSKGPALGCRPSECLLAWSDASQGLRVARIDPVGVVKPPGTVTVSQSGAFELDHTVAWDGASYIVTWSKYTGWAFELYAARVSGDGIVVDPGGKLLLSGLQQNPKPAAGADTGQRFLAWTQSTSTGKTPVRASRLGPSLELLDAGGVEIWDGAAQLPTSVTVAAELGSFAVAWADTSSSIRTARVTNAIPETLAIASGSAPRLAARGSTVVATWRDGEQHIRVGSVDKLELGSKVVSLSPAKQTQPDLAVDGAGRGLAVWTDYRAGHPRVYGRYLDEEGKADGTSAFGIAIWSHSPAVARAVGGSYLTVQVASDAVGIPGPIVGHFVDGPSINLPISQGVPAKSAPRVACNLAVCLVTWLDDRNGLTEIYGARVTGAGVLDPKGIDITLPAAKAIESERFAVLAMESKFLVLWAGGAATVGSDGIAAEFSDDDSKGVPVGWGSRAWTVAGNGEVCLAIANEESAASGVTFVGPTHALLLGSSGERLADLVLDATTEPNLHARVGVTWDGANFVVATRGRAYRVSSLGKPLAEPVAIDQLDEPVIAPLNPARLVHFGIGPDPVWGVGRAFVQTITRDTDAFPLGAGCTIDAECASGACVQQMCCASKCALGLECNPNGSGCAQVTPDGGLDEEGGADAADTPDATGSGSAKQGVQPDGGCACRARPSAEQSQWAFWLVLAVLGVSRKRRAQRFPPRVAHEP